VVARGGIEPPTRGFSVQRRARFGASKPKTGNEFFPSRPNRPARPTPCRTGAPRARSQRRSTHASQRFARVRTELLPNRPAADVYLAHSRRSRPTGAHPHGMGGMAATRLFHCAATPEQPWTVRCAARRASTAAQSQQPELQANLLACFAHLQEGEYIEVTTRIVSHPAGVDGRSRCRSRGEPEPSTPRSYLDMQMVVLYNFATSGCDATLARGMGEMHLCGPRSSLLP
jgi:hypothetical protein